MAQSRDDPEFFLPSHFLTDDVVLDTMYDNNKRGNNNLRQNTVGAFPALFPYDFDSSDSNSPVESVVGSTETDSSSSDEEDFFAGLTRRLAQSSLLPPPSTEQTQKLSVPAVPKEKPEWVVSGSPQSTLSGIGSWSSNGSPTGPSSQVPSPPTTPFGAQNDTWDLIYAAAGQVARLKKLTNGGVDGGATNNFSCNQHHSRGLLGPPRTPSPSSLPCHLKNPTPALCQNHSFNQFQHVSSATWGKQVKQLPSWSAQPHQQPHHHHHHQQIHHQGHAGNLPQSAWPPLQVQQHQHQRNNASIHHPILPHGSNSVKRESAGTGVFLPRRYTNPASEPRRRTGCPTVLLPAKVVQALNLNYEDMNGRSQPLFDAGLAQDHEALVARRNALLTQQRRGIRAEGLLNYEVRLPQEWTY